MTLVQKIQAWMSDPADRRTDLEKAEAAGLRSRQEWYRFRTGQRVPTLETLAQILPALQPPRCWADLD